MDMETDMDTDMDTDMETDMDTDMDTDMETDTDMDMDMKHGHGNRHGHAHGQGHGIYNITLYPHEENTSGGIYYVWGGGRRKIHLVESTMSKWPYLADKCCALRNNYKLGPFLTKTPRCLGFLVFHIL
jgi:hypothetical protein